MPVTSPKFYRHPASIPDHYLAKRMTDSMSMRCCRIGALHLRTFSHVARYNYACIDLRSVEDELASLNLFTY
jgi:hypothetical protein